jgi:hypothetical protein
MPTNSTSEHGGIPSMAGLGQTIRDGKLIEGWELRIGSWKLLAQGDKRKA